MLKATNNLAERRMWLNGKRNDAASIGRLTLLVTGKRALVFDIGANVGAYTLPLATEADPGSKVVAFEPNPNLARRLRENIRLNGLDGVATVEEVALGARAHIGVLNLDADNLGKASLNSIRSTASISVPVEPLKAYLPETMYDYDIFLIKIDVEGYEDEVLIPFLSESRRDELPEAIMLEIIHRDRWRADLFRCLDELGYATRFFGEDDNALLLRK